MNRSDVRPGVVAGTLLALALAVGFLGGIAADRLLLSPRASIAAEPAAATPGDVRTPGERMRDRSGHGRMAGDRYLDRMATELELSDDQRARIDEILRDQSARMREIARETRPRMQAVTSDTRSAIQAVLTPEQEARFREMRPRGERRMTGPGPREGRRNGEPRQDP